MKLVYKGKFNGDETSLPRGEHMPGAVKFKEAESAKQLAVIANMVSLVILLALFALMFWRTRSLRTINLWGMVLAMLSAYPHEFLHAVCFKETVYLYTNWKQGMLFVVGPEIMSRRRFVLMSLCPNLVFGLLPYLLFLLHPAWTALGTMGAMALSMGAGDYYNAFNAMTQMPKGAKTYLYQFNSWWFMPEEA